jgi:hypothetical protein
MIKILIELFVLQIARLQAAITTTSLFNNVDHNITHIFVA